MCNLLKLAFFHSALCFKDVFMLLHPTVIHSLSQLNNPLCDFSKIYSSISCQWKFRLFLGVSVVVFLPLYIIQLEIFLYMSPGSHVLKVSLGFIHKKRIVGHRECM